jgi:hypothetical protein
MTGIPNYTTMKISKFHIAYFQNKILMKQLKKLNNFVPNEKQKGKAVPLQAWRVQGV